ncbi:MAG TPA: aminotransferase class V-fold PLP-dependent enzyme [Candidatus Kapabacteria bacterium]|nr:aminotransferase class V-fold PLP-dependent enzyme [Candidatus Kapabacteria bacterium]
MIYLNNTATSYPKPISVISALNDYFNNPPTNFGRSSAQSSLSIIGKIREQIIDFFGANDDYNVVFTSGSTEAINLVIFGLDLSTKELIITSNEHNAVIRPLMELKSHNKIDIKIADCDENGHLDVTKIESLINENTALIIVNYVSNVTGNIQDVKSISQIAKKHNIKLLVDGSQAAGNIPIHLNESQVDFFAFTSHKSLYGIQGSGGLIIKKNLDIKPLKYGGTGFKSTMLTQPDEFPYKYESGTQNIPGILSISKGIEFINEIGLDNIILHKEKLMKRVIHDLSSIERVKLYFDIQDYSNSVLSFNIEDYTPDEVSYILQSSYGIEVRSGVHCAPLVHHNLGTYPSGTVRVSPSYFTNDNEITMFLDAIHKLAAE